MLFSTVAASTYIPCNGVPGFLFFHILASTYFYQDASLLKFLILIIPSFKMFIILYMCVCLVAQSCPILCEFMYCSQPGSSVHGILQARILEWVAIPFSKGSSPPRDQMRISCIADGFFIVRSHEGSPSCWSSVFCLFLFKKIGI